jgi:hypothetical protein
VGTHTLVVLQFFIKWCMNTSLTSKGQSHMHSKVNVLKSRSIFREVWNFYEVRGLRSLGVYPMKNCKTPDLPLSDFQNKEPYVRHSYNKWIQGREKMVQKFNAKKAEANSKALSRLGHFEYHFQYHFPTPNILEVGRHLY